MEFIIALYPFGERGKKSLFYLEQKSVLPLQKLIHYHELEILTEVARWQECT